MFEKIRKNIEGLEHLQKVPADTIRELKDSFTGIPGSYLSFLEEVGHGNLGEIQIYKSPMPPEEVYGPERAECLAGIVLFGDDMQGYCFGFDASDGYRVVEVGPRGEVDKTIEPDFVELLSGYFS